MKDVYVVGHRNPDTDSICSAIAYANLKNKITGTELYHPYRAGHINEETRYVLNKAGVETPVYLKDLRTQVSDMQIRETESVRSNISIKKAWTMMKEAGVVTLPVVKNKKLEGIINITDIATSYMEVYDERVLENARTTYKQIAETLDGRIVCGNTEHKNVRGKVITAVATPEVMEEQIETGDLVILGNRYEAQLCAIEMGADCIIICDKAPVTMTITKLAQAGDCTIISSPHDAFTVSRLIYQSMPIDYVMKKENLITFRVDDFIDDIKKVMTEKRHRDFPVLDAHGHYVGMISRRNLLGAEKKKVILVDHNEAKQAVYGIESAQVLEIVDHHRLGAIETVAPVLFCNRPVGCTATIIYGMYKSFGISVDPVMAFLMCSAIISDTLMFRSPTCTTEDREAAEELAKVAGIELEAHARGMFSANSNLSEKTARELLITLAETDLMTSVLNRGSGEQKTRDRLRAGQGGLLGLLDIDHFKKFNDDFGHDIGDKVIIEVARALKEAFRDEDIVFRLGGDEFAVFAPSVSDIEAGNGIIGRFIRKLDAIRIDEIGDRMVTISMGVTLVPKKCEMTFEELYRYIDARVYESKKKEGNSVTFGRLD